MNLTIEKDCTNIDWDEVSNLLKEVGMAFFEADKHKKAFENSYSVIFLFDENKLIGFGRTISDGVYQGAIYDVAVSPRYQGKKLGALIIKDLIDTLPNCNILLYASPGKEIFYEKLGFDKMKTGMASFINKEKMKLRGFIE